MPTASLARKPRGAYHHGDLERALLTAALQTIREDGVDALTLRSVGARLGVSRTALYRHFDDKAALLARVAAEGFRLLHAALSRAIARAGARNTEQLEAMGIAYVRFAMQNRAHYQTMFGGYLTDWSLHPDLLQNADATFRLLAETIHEQQRQGRIVAGNPIELAEITWSLVHGLGTLGAAGRIPKTGTSVEGLVTLGSRLLESGLRRKTARPRRPRAAARRHR